MPSFVFKCVGMYLTSASLSYMAAGAYEKFKTGQNTINKEVQAEAGLG